MGEPNYAAAYAVLLAVAALPPRDQLEVLELAVSLLRQKPTRIGPVVPEKVPPPEPAAQTAPAPAPPQEIMTLRDVAEYLGVHSRTIARMTARGQFPKPVKVGSANRWRRKDVMEWFESTRRRP